MTVFWLLLKHFDRFIAGMSSILATTKTLDHASVGVALNEDQADEIVSAPLRSLNELIAHRAHGAGHHPILGIPQIHPIPTSLAASGQTEQQQPSLTYRTHTYAELDDLAANLAREYVDRGILGPRKAQDGKRQMTVALLAPSGWQYVLTELAFCRLYVRICARPCMFKWTDNEALHPFPRIAGTAQLFCRQTILSPHWPICSAQLVPRTSFITQSTKNPPMEQPTLFIQSTKLPRQCRRPKRSSGSHMTKHGLARALPEQRNTRLRSTSRKRRTRLRSVCTRVGPQVRSSIFFFCRKIAQLREFDMLSIVQVFPNRSSSLIEHRLPTSTPTSA